MLTAINIFSPEVSAEPECIKLDTRLNARALRIPGALPSVSQLLSLFFTFVIHPKV